MKILALFLVTLALSSIALSNSKKNLSKLTNTEGLASTAGEKIEATTHGLANNKDYVLHNAAVSYL